MAINFDKLQNHVPENSIPILQKWFNQCDFILKIKKKRNSKFGDFKVDTRFNNPEISVNADLNEYAFLITLTHEFAHLLVWKQHQHRVKAHGEEWKNEFRLLMNVLLQKNVFPDDIFVPLYKHMQNPAASSARDVDLIKALKKYDLEQNTIHLDDLPEGSKFSINNKKIFIKGIKQRTRYLCEEVISKKKYLIHGIADVELVES
jgi:SprT protein